MKDIKTVEIIIWNDAVQHMHQDLSEEYFNLSQTAQFGIVDKEDHEKLRIIHGFSCDSSANFDYMNLPISCIVKRIVIGHFNTETFEFKCLDEKDK